MTLQPLLLAPLAVQIHVAAVLPAALIGAWILARPKGTRLHRLLGRFWMVLMAVTAISSFFIHQLNLFHGFSPIHILSVLVLTGIWRSIAAARAHDIRKHRAHVTGLYFGGIVGAGLFTLIPGRIMHSVLFGGNAPASVALGVVVLCVVALATTGLLRGQSSARRM